MRTNTPSDATSSAAHAINNHLMVVIGLADLLERKLSHLDNANGEAIKMVCKIRRAAADAASVTKRIY